MRHPLSTLALLSFFTFFLGVGRPAINDSDEGFYAEASREMVEHNDWLTPHFNYEERWEKPILYYWLTAATYAAAGTSEWTARFWSALSGAGLVLLTWATARRLTPSDDAAWLAGAIVATCFGYFAMARSALPDLPLAFCITLTIWAALGQQWMLAGVAAGLGFLAKGPVAVALPALVLIPIWWRERRSTPTHIRDIALAAIVFALIALPWYLAMTVAHGTEYLRSFFLTDNVARFATDRFNDPRPFWFYVPVVIAGMLPWSPYLVGLWWRSAVAVVRRQRRLTDEEWRLLMWVALPLIFFALSIGKQPRYILPVLPPLAILTARSITTRIQEADTSVPRALEACTWITAGLFAVLGLLLYRAKPLFITALPGFTDIAILIIGACALAFAWVAGSRRWRQLPVTAAFCAAALLLAIQFGALAGARPEAVEQMASLIQANRTSEEVGAYQVFVRNLVFYTRFKHVELFDEARALDFLKSPRRVLMVVRATDLPRLESMTGVAARRLGEVQYLNTANLRLGMVLSPLPAQDLETVLLVANR
jgi:4-amino-4-deoxy-L-arabinose transferase-like glycosyltransferase